MNSPWKPDESRPPKSLMKRGEWKGRIKDHWQETTRGPMPEGGKAGLLLVAAACIGVALIAYKVWGPSDAIFRP